MPLLRISAVSARVSMPDSPMMPRARSHWSRWRGGAIVRGIGDGGAQDHPRAPGVAAMFTVSISSSLVPTLPICGKVKVMSCPA